MTPAIPLPINEVPMGPSTKVVGMSSCVTILCANGQVVECWNDLEKNMIPTGAQRVRPFWTIDTERGVVKSWWEAEMAVPVEGRPRNGATMCRLQMVKIMGSEKEQRLPSPIRLSAS